MPIIRPLFKSGSSWHATIPMTWLKRIKEKLGVMPKSIMYVEQGDDLVVKAVNLDKDTEEK